MRASLVQQNQKLLAVYQGAESRGLHELDAKAARGTRKGFGGETASSAQVLSSYNHHLLEK